MLLRAGRDAEFRNPKFSEFKYSSDLRGADHPHTDHQVFLAHSGAGDVGMLINQQFYFEDPRTIDPRTIQTDALRARRASRPRESLHRRGQETEQ
jgi:hypothetical protein